MYSPFHQLRKPADQQNALENVSQFPAHLVPGKFKIFKLVTTDICSVVEAHFRLPLDNCP